MIGRNKFVTDSDVPFQLSTLRAFIVQSKSSQDDWLKWWNRYNSFFIPYYMKPWSLSELIMGRSLQNVGKPCSDADLEMFHSRYAPLASTAYIYAYQHRLSTYNDIITTEISTLTFDRVETMAEGVSHHILLVSPDSDRQCPKITIPTRYIYLMLRDHLHVQTLEDAARLYQVFVRNWSIETSTGYIFDDIHDLFCRGGEWKVIPMHLNKAGFKNTYFKAPGGHAKSSYVRLGYDGDPVQVARQSLRKTAEFVPLACHRYLLDQSIALENGYYQPTLDQPTFDGFIHDEASKTATILRMAIATEHNAETKIIEWLGNQGVENFYFMAVTPPDTLPDL